MDIPNPRPQGTKCPSLPLLLITSHLPIPHPSSLTPPSLWPLTVHSVLCPSSQLSLLLNLPSLVSLSLSVLSPWPHLSSSSGSLIFLFLVSINLAFLLPLVIHIHFFSYCYPLLALFSPLPVPQASSHMEQHSHQKPRGSHEHTHATDIPAERSRSTLMPTRGAQL